VIVTHVFDRIQFNPKFHQYSLDGKRLQNVTSIVSKRLQKPFNAEEISARVAKKRGVEQQVVLDEWAAIRDNGTRVHEQIAARLRDPGAEEDAFLTMAIVPEMEAFNSLWGADWRDRLLEWLEDGGK
jgi:hypothetical protein